MREVIIAILLLCLLNTILLLNHTKQKCCCKDKNKENFFETDRISTSNYYDPNKNGREISTSFGVRTFVPQKKIGDDSFLFN
jgi:hypothetical protein